MIISQDQTPSISFLTKNIKKLLHPSGVDCRPSSEPLWEPWGWGKVLAKILLISPITKVPLSSFEPFTIKSFISSPSTSNFQSHYVTFILAAVISVVSYFKF